MAIIKVKGTVTKVFWEAKGLIVTESYTTRAGDTIDKQFTVWLKQPTTLDIGDTVQVEGLMSVDIEPWLNQDGSPKLNREGQPGQSIKVSINNPLVVPAEPLNIIKGIFEPTHEPSPF